MSSGLGLRTWGLRLASTTHLHSTRRRSYFSSLSFPPRRVLTTTCSVSNPVRGEKKQKVIVISGPTGSGKSRLALELAKRLNGEIISADSVQVCANPPFCFQLIYSTATCYVFFFFYTNLGSRFSVIRCIGDLILDLQSLCLLIERFLILCSLEGI